ncbi:polysaccharide biosynthesis protein [Paludicola sp. MB14-C6]|uniref:putative polysaccharide biosynthesis protein n=1 Tax=Paludihabitans sp. MB14-C6 TaxID=3070656 RepID=UPI0027DD8C6E|nr:polysaccharide biosynthesis protein [Paludicola sp. MB14-C6]WMJ23666.1 polysaccharide biosynthesis protein [Paludicola sp. MB14-C6]
MTKQKKQSFLYGASILMASMIIVKLIGALFKIPINNILHETGMAYFNQAYTIFTTIYALTVTGLSAAVARMVAENAAKERYRDVRKLLKVSTIIFVILGILGSITIVLSAKFIVSAAKMPNAFWSIVMVSPAIFFCCLMASYRGYYEGLSNMIPTAITQVVEVVVKLVAGLLFSFIVLKIANSQFKETGKVFGVVVDNLKEVNSVAIPYAAAAAILGVSVSTLVGFIYIFIRFKVKGDFITKEQILNSPKPMRSKVLYYRLFKIAIPITLGAVVIQLSVLIDNLTIPDRLSHAFSSNPTLFNDLYGHLLEKGDVMNVFLFGCFSTVLAIFNLVPAFTNIFGKSSLPNVTAAWTVKDKQKVKVNIESVIRVTMLIAAPASMGIAFLSGPIIKLLFRKLAGAVAIGPGLLSVLAVGALFLSLVTPVNSIMQGIGRVDLPVKYLLVGASLKLILNIILVGIPSINIMGASISTVVCYSVIAFLSINKLRKIVGVKLNFVSILVKPMIAGLSCGISAFLCYKTLTLWIENSIITVFSICVGALVYVIVLALINAISVDDVLMLPKGNKIAKTLEKLRIIR